MSQLDRPATLADVARLAGVSVPAASRVLNGGVRGRESGLPELRERIESAARELGYSVSTAAQTVKGGRARTVALLVNQIDDFGAAVMISGIMHAAENRGISVAVRETRDDPERERDALMKLRGERHRAVIVATSRTTDALREAAVERELKVLAEQGAQVVIIGDNSLGFRSVTVDNRDAARRLAIGLVDAGATSFAVVSAPGAEITARERLGGFLEGLASRDIVVSESDVVHAEFSRDGGHEAAGHLIDRIGQLDVIAAMSDAMAVGVISRLREVGFRTPEDVEVTGFDHIPLLADLLPDFTTVEVPLRSFGEAALALALDRHRPGDPDVIALRATPIVRGAVLEDA